MIHASICPWRRLPVNKSSNVVFPQPDGPMIATSSPVLKYAETPFRILFVDASSSFWEQSLASLEIGTERLSDPLCPSPWLLCKRGILLPARDSRVELPFMLLNDPGCRSWREFTEPVSLPLSFGSSKETSVSSSCKSLLDSSSRRDSWSEILLFLSPLTEFPLFSAS